MDTNDKEIFPYLPYILQDFWEIGSSPADMIALIEKHSTNYSALKILDLGCGKGAVSIKIAEKLHCECWGIDGVKEFIEYADKKAVEYNVETLCRFEQADIREKINELPQFDVIILGAIGQVFGNYYETLTKLKKCLKKGGLILIDDAYIEDSSEFSHSALLKKSELLGQVNEANMEIIDELFPNDNATIEEQHEQEFNFIKQRCDELIEKYPEKKSLFENYVQKQDEEYDTLETKVVGLTMAIKAK
jgi:cyclopropane fatty-acyl-phospholipid synthase-like methyltransferase